MKCRWDFMPGKQTIDTIFIKQQTLKDYKTKKVTLNNDIIKKNCKILVSWGCSQLWRSARSCYFKNKM